MITISQKESGAIYIDGVSFGFPEDIKAVIVDTNYIEIVRENLQIKEVRKTHFSFFKRQDGSVFNSAQDFKNYFDSELSLSRSIKNKVFNINPNSVLLTTIDYSKFVNGFVSVSLGDVEINPLGTIDPSGVSSLDANLINNNLTDLCYNNTSEGSSNKPLPAINLENNSGVDRLKIWWWNNTYTCSNWKLQGSTDGSVWFDIITNLNSVGIVGTANNPVTLNVNENYSKFRVFSVTGNNASWVVLSEIKAYKNSPLTKSNIFNSGSQIEIKEENGKLKILNLSSGPTEVEINYL